jgi:hypothetical protein
MNEAPTNASINTDTGDEAVRASQAGVQIGTIVHCLHNVLRGTI